MKKKAEGIKNKDEVAEDWCFVCKDGGSLIICDYKQCLKSYHPDCVEKDESFFEAGNYWTCKWHSCLICHKSSKFQCLCCPNAVCHRCIVAAEFACVRGNKGFCNDCLKLALLGEENMEVDSDGETVDFKDRETYEGLFFEYWEIIKEKEGLSLEHLHRADELLKKGAKYKSKSYSEESDKDEEIQLLPDQLLSDDDDDMTEGKSVQKTKRSGEQLFTMKTGLKSNKREFIGWGSKSLMNFLVSFGIDTSKKLSQFDVSSIIIRYISENNLFDPGNKRKIFCDERLKSVLGRKKVNRNKIYDLLDPHFLENLDQLEQDKMGYSSEDEDEDGNALGLVACKKQRKLSTSRKSQEKEVVFDAPHCYFAAIVADNIKLVYLKRSLVQELLKQPETFEFKVTGSFVRVKSEHGDHFQRNSHQLVQVTGMKKTSLGENSTEILLQVSNISKDIRISMLSDDNFSEEECEDLKQKVKGGLLAKPTIVEFEQKARSLHEDITNHWIVRELALLQNLIDQANEKGWRNKLFDYLERRRLLQTPFEKLRLLQKVPNVIADVAEAEYTMSKDAIKEYLEGDERSSKSILTESSEAADDNSGGSGISSGDRAIANGNSSFGNVGSGSANDGNGNEQVMKGNNAGNNVQVTKEEDQGCVSIIEVKQSHTSKTCNLAELVPDVQDNNAPEDQSNVILQHEPHQSSSHIAGQKKSQPKDLEQKDTTIEESSPIQSMERE